MSGARPAGPSALAATRAILLGDGIDPEFFTRTAQRFPRVAYVRLGREQLYFLSHPEPVRQALIDSARVSTKNRGLQGARRILGDGLLTSENPYHQHARRLIQPAFHADRMPDYTAVMRTAAAQLSARWRAGARVDMAADMSALTFRIVGGALFGTALDSAGPVRAALSELLAAYNRAFLPWFEVSLRLGTPLGRRVRAASAQLDQVVRDLIARQRHAPAPNLISTLLDDFTEEQLRDEAMTLLLAGHETTGAALTFAWYLLDRHPQIRSWLEEELDAAEPDLAAADVAALPRTRAVIAETMRLYPPAWTVGRRFTEPVVLDGWAVPAGASALIPQWVLHRDGRFWERPREFVPQRWLRSGTFGLTVPGQPRYAYLPFGAGARKCIGEAFAWTEAVLVLAILARDWRAAAAPDHRLRAAITLRPADPLPMTLHRR
ncbi:MAG TPA: cytochrome P450 [Mycobacteriales bacterium]|nr:cytochrome P450 [Mycobacteriales bacterium]